MPCAPLDAWLLRRLLACHDVNGELARVSEPFRPIADRLAREPLAGRQALWDAYLDAMAEEDVGPLVEALASQDPDGPSPDSETWEAPDLGKSVPALPFPVDVFPEALARLCLEASEAIRCPVDYLGSSALAVAAGAIGQSVNLEVKGNWTEAPELFVANVGKSGKTKSPALRFMVRPLRTIDLGLRLDYAREKEEWDRQDPKDGPPPVPLRAVVSDITRESLVIVLQENPRGVLCFLDELSAWVAGMNQYKTKGTDRQFWLSVWACETVSVDRKGGRESFFVPYPLAVVVGGLPPSMLSSLREEKGRDDGFLERILFAFPDELAFPSQEWTENVISESAEGEWTEAIRRLAGRSMADQDEGRPRPTLVRFTPDAKAAWVEWWDTHAKEVEGPSFDESLAGTWSKLRAHAARLALILGQLEWAYDPFADPDPPDVSARAVRGAIRLIDYFKAGARRARAELTGEAVSIPNDARAVLRWVTRSGKSSFSEADLNEVIRRFYNEPAKREAALKWLIGKNCLRRQPEPPRPAGKRGRQPAPTYDVNPALFGSMNSMNSDYCLPGDESTPPGGDKPNSSNSSGRHEGDATSGDHDQSVPFGGEG